MSALSYEELLARLEQAEAALEEKDQALADQREMFTGLRPGETTSYNRILTEGLTNPITDEQFRAVMRTIRAELDTDNTVIEIELSSGRTRVFPFNRKITIAGDREISIIGAIRNAVVDSEPLEEDGDDDIDYQQEFQIEDIEKITIYELQDPRQRARQTTGGFYPSFNTTRIDLERYDIYTRSNAKWREPKNCLQVALEKYGIPEEKIDYLKSTFFQHNFTHTDNFERLSEIIEHRITLHKVYRNGRRAKPVVFGSGDENIDIALYNDHYFLLEPTQYTLFSIRNYEKVNRLKDWHKIYKVDRGSYIRDHRNKAKRIDSLELVKLLDEKGLVNEVDNMLLPEETEKKVEELTLDYIEEEQSRWPFKRHIGMKRVARRSLTIDMVEIGKPGVDPVDWCAELLSDFYEPDDDEIGDAADELEEEGNEFPEESEVFQRAYRNKLIELREEATQTVAYADSEAIVSAGKHRLLAIGVKIKGQPVQIFSIKDYEVTSSVVQAFLNFLSENKVRKVYFHNIKYDNSLIGKYLPITDEVFCDNRLYSVTCHLNGDRSTYRFIDSYKLIPAPLSNFKKMFGLEGGKKEAISYSYYTEDNLDKLIPPEEYRKLLKPEEQEIFDEASVPFIKDGLFDPYAYYMDYLKHDVLTLEAGMEAFDEHLRYFDPALSIYDYLTIGSLAVAANYEDLRKFTPCSGNLRAIIGHAFTGGDVQYNEKVRKKFIPGPHIDQDANSLYPSAMSRASKEKRFRSGRAQRRTDDWQRYLTIMKVKITKVRIKHNPPLMVLKQQKGVNIHTNDMEGKIIWLDGGTLQNYVDFCGVEFEILDGVQWRGPVVQLETIDRLYAERRAAKKAGNIGLSNVLKLLMNSAYGKTIEKQRFTTHKFVSAKKALTFYLNNKYMIKSYEKLNNVGNRYLMHTVDMSGSIPQVGATILSTAKRIMFEFRDCAREAGVEILYTDTDSIHMLKFDFLLTDRVYQRRYGRSLDDYSGDMGRFHTDFPGGASHSDEFIVFGKKAYAHKVGGKWYATFKGITAKGIKYIEDKGLKEDGTRYTGDLKVDLLEPLSRGEPVRVLMNPPGYTPSFDIQFDNITFKRPFYRTLQF